MVVMNKSKIAFFHGFGKQWF